MTCEEYAKLIYDHREIVNLVIIYPTRLKGLPVINREHFCKTRTNYYEILPCSIFTSNTKIGTSNTNCYFKYQLLLQIPIVTSNTNCYFNYQLLLRIPKLVLRIPIVTLNRAFLYGRI
jgi:hypothetical protein